MLVGIMYFIKKNVDLASVGAAVGIGLLLGYAFYKFWDKDTEAVAHRVREYVEDLGIHDNVVDSWDADRYINEIASLLELLFY